MSSQSQFCLAPTPHDASYGRSAYDASHGRLTDDDAGAWFGVTDDVQSIDLGVESDDVRHAIAARWLIRKLSSKLRLHLLRSKCT